MTQATALRLGWVKRHLENWGYLIAIATTFAVAFLWIGANDRSMADMSHEADLQREAIKENRDSLTALSLSIEGRLSNIEGQNKEIIRNLDLLNSKLK
jgi:hypothetical protein